MPGIYFQHIAVTDFGPYVHKLTLAMPREVAAEEIRADQWLVYVELLNMDGSPVLLPRDFLHRDELLPSRGYRPVRAAYPCSADGGRLDRSRLVALEMPYGPAYPCSAAMAADFTNINGHERYVICDYSVTQTAPVGEGETLLTGLRFTRCGGVKNPDRELFRLAESTHPSIPLRYGYFVPEIRLEKHPLIVWLHGAGEGGDDTAISFTGNKVPALVKDEVQRKFGGAFVFSPQCPTMWLDDGSGEYHSEGRSMYVEALKYAIDEFITRYEGAIDRSRIYVGGDSNGGFMTMRMVIDYPDFFAAAFPICEALADRNITDAQLRRLEELPIWFAQGAKDPVVKPEVYAEATWKRLKAAGAKKAILTMWEQIVDLHGEFTDPDGRPHVWFDHFAWIPVLNNDCKTDRDGQPVTVDGREVTLFDWIALQRRS